MKKVFSLLVVLLTVVAGCVAQSVTAQGSEGYSTRRVISKPMPIYPGMALSMNLSGTVTLQAVVNANGSVKSLQARDGESVFSQAAESAIQAWKWEKTDRETLELIEVRFNP